MEPKLPGCGFLKVTGILMIVFGSILVVMNGLAWLGVSALAAIGGAEIDLGMMYIGVVLSFLGSIAELATGIIGVVNCNKADKAKLCLVWGVIVVVMTLLGNIIVPFAGGQFSIVNLIIGMIVPALFVLGAVKNSK